MSEKVVPVRRNQVHVWTFLTRDDFESNGVKAMAVVTPLFAFIILQEKREKNKFKSGKMKLVVLHYYL